MLKTLGAQIKEYKCADKDERNQHQRNNLDFFQAEDGIRDSYR